jgi:hypothetical protein
MVTEHMFGDTDEFVKTALLAAACRRTGGVAKAARPFDTRDQARDFKHDLLVRLARGTWIAPRLGKQPLETWAREWWKFCSADPDRSPATLQRLFDLARTSVQVRSVTRRPVGGAASWVGRLPP